MVMAHSQMVGFGTVCLRAPLAGADGITQNFAYPLDLPYSNNRLHAYRHRGSTLMRPDNGRETAGNGRTGCMNAAASLHADDASDLQCFLRPRRTAKTGCRPARQHKDLLPQPFV